MSGSRDVSVIYELNYNPAFRPRRSPNAFIQEIEVEGKPTFVLTKEPEGDYYEVDDTTSRIWSLLDGEKTIGEVFGEVKESNQELTEKDVRAVVISLAEEGVIASAEVPSSEKRVEVVSAFQVNVKLLKNSSESLAGLYGVTRRLIRREWLPIGVAVSALGLLLSFGTMVQIYSDPVVLEVAGSALIGFLFYQMVVLLPVYAVHELAHGAALDYYGGKPRAIGTGLYYLAPFFYCDTTDSWRLPRRARIMVSMAGPLSTLVISAVLVFWSYLIPAGYPQTVLKISGFFGYYGTLINFSPVIETDGYYVLADVLKVPNLRDEAFSFAKRGLLRLVGSQGPKVRQSRKRTRIVAVYSVIMFAWLALFGYTTVWLMLLYGQDAYVALSVLGLMLLQVQPFEVVAFAVSIATLLYFSLTVAGFGVMGAVASKKVRMKGVKLETIHAQRASVFLPLPSYIGKRDGEKFVGKVKKASKESGNSFSVTLEPPLCVAALKRGRVDSSLGALKGDILDVERRFRAIHSEFVAKALGSGASQRNKEMESDLLSLASHLPRGKKEGIGRFLRRQRELEGYVLRSGFGTVWTLSLSPDDYSRVRREMLFGLIAEDLGESDLAGELERFKRRTVVGSDAIESLSSEVEKESKEVYKNPELYQVTAYLEPVKSRLVFLGRTDKVEGSVVWLGGLFLYQAWVSFMAEQLTDATLGMRAVRLAASPFGKAQAAKLPETELKVLREDAERMGRLVGRVEEAMTRVEATYESANNFHQSLASLMGDEGFDIGLYEPILKANARHLEGVKEELEGFREEFARVAKRVASMKEALADAGSGKGREPGLGLLRKLWGRPSEGFAFQVAQMNVLYRTLYGVVQGSDIVL